MDIPTHSDRSIHWLHVRLLQQEVTHIVTEFLERKRVTKKNTQCPTSPLNHSLSSTDTSLLARPTRPDPPYYCNKELKNLLLSLKTLFIQQIQNYEILSAKG